jgi:hypothetical protein
MTASASGRLILEETAALSRVRKMRVCGIGCFFGGTTCDYRPPPVTEVRAAWTLVPKPRNL